MTATNTPLIQESKERSATIGSVPTLYDLTDFGYLHYSDWNHPILSESLAPFLDPYHWMRSKAPTSPSQYSVLLPSRSTATLVIDMQGSAAVDATEGLIEESLPLVARTSYSVKASIRFLGPAPNSLLSGKEILED